ncbi:MAG: DUF523 domain-containing protein [Pseudomonadota bacterium]
MIIVSACLAGVNCRYDGVNNYSEKVIRLVKDGKVILVCPEQLGGLSTPRKPSEIKNGKVVNQDGICVNSQFEKGALETLKIALMYGCDKAIMQERSPSCGVKKIYNGNFNLTLIAGQGITTKLLLKNKIKVISSEDL